jgi:23S rRNA pseudouridine2604 synthase
MCEYLEYDVVSLKRERIMNISLGDLKIGKWRDLTTEEINGLQEAVSDSKNAPAASKIQPISRKRS